jgi:hypothetical protein
MDLDDQSDAEAIRILEAACGVGDVFASLLMGASGGA